MGVLPFTCDVAAILLGTGEPGDKDSRARQLLACVRQRH